MIKIKNITKTYKLYSQPQDRLKEALHPFRKTFHQDFHALKDISFNIKKGETIGIIGKNGAGKSTLLKILTGVLTPTSGAYEVSGKVASLLELGAGFNPELSGLENVYFNGSILGYTKEEMDQKLEDILNFADIGEFIHQPVKTYSSGMYVRLAFAVAINVDPEVLIIDEALSVGDVRFQLKCFRKLEEIKKKGTTILFVTHDMGTVMNHCDQVIWLHDGETKDQGKPEDICKKYMSFMAYGMEMDSKNKSVGANNHSPIKKTESNKNIPWKSVAGCDSFGEGGAQITHVAFYDPKTMEAFEVLDGGEEVCFSFRIISKIDITNPIIGFTLKDTYGNALIGTNTLFADYLSLKLNKGEPQDISFYLTLPKLKNGTYIFSPAIAEGSQEKHIQHHWIHDALCFQVQNSHPLAKMGFLLVSDNIKIQLN